MKRFVSCSNKKIYAEILMTWELPSGVVFLIFCPQSTFDTLLNHGPPLEPSMKYYVKSLVEDLVNHAYLLFKYLYMMIWKDHHPNFFGKLSLGTAGRLQQWMPCLICTCTLPSVLCSTLVMRLLVISSRIILLLPIIGLSFWILLIGICCSLIMFFIH